jgi:hypothetical protein
MQPTLAQRLAIAGKILDPVKRQRAIDRLKMQVEAQRAAIPRAIKIRK